MGYGGTQPTATVTAEKAVKITVTFIGRSASQIEFSVEGNSGGEPPNNTHTIEFGDLRIRPAQGTLASGEIRNVGSAAPGGTTNYGTISMAAGADDRIRAEDSPDAGGNLIGSMNLKAGNSFTVYSNVRDQFNNFKRNEAASWSLANITGGIVPGNLVPFGNNRSALFTGELTGTANIEASFGGLTPIQTGLITVGPSSPEELIVQTEPTGTSQEAVAGQIFSPQPKIAVLDEFGNIVNDNTIQVSAERISGDGALQGITSVNVSNGVAAFTDLAHHTANDITLSFSASGLPSVTSQTLTIHPAAADALIFLDDIPNGSPDSALNPPVEVQLIDEFGNNVPEENVGIELILVTENAGSISGNITNTNPAGLATFDSLQFNQTGTKVIQAISADNTLQSPTSNEFTIAGIDELAGFLVENTGGGTPGTQTAGQEFNIRITAVNGLGDPLDGSQGSEFTGYVDLTTTGSFSGTTDSTQVGPFAAGVYDPHPVTLTAAGSTRIRATNAAAGESQSGTSNYFTVHPASASSDSSFMTAEPEALISDGVSESVITFQLVDAFGNELTDDIAETVEIFMITNNGGSLSSTVGNGDGTYSAVLTASNTVGTDEIGASIDGTDITSGNPIITYKFDDLSTFAVELVGGGQITDQIAGESFDTQITAFDEFGNVVESFDGSTVEITSDQTLLTGGGTTAAFTNGILSPHSVSFSSAGTATLTVRRTSSPETGISNTFTIHPAAPDPATSTITPARNFLQSDGTDNTTVTVQLRDEFNNTMVDGGSSVALFTTAGSLSGVTDHNNGTYSATLTAGTAFETATITGTVNNADIIGEAEVFISQFNRWTAAAGGQPVTRSDWSNANNWSLGSLPATGQIILIPSEDINGDPIDRFPILSDDNQTVENPVLDFLIIEQGANITLSDRTLIVNEEISGNGSLYANNGLIHLGGNVTLANFIAGSSDVFFNGTSTQTLDGDFTGNNLNIDNDVTVKGYFEAFSSVNIATDRLLLFDPGSKFVVMGDLNISGALSGSESDFTIGGDINGSSITLTETRLTFNGEAPQAINGIKTLKSFTVDNPTTVTVYNDLVISDTLNIRQGLLTVNSGFNLATNVTTGQTASIRMLRDIGNSTSEPGWRLLSTPLQATYQNFFDGTVTQGFENSSYGFTDSNGDSLQPNVLFYDETIKGTDNQRWRAPDNAAEDMTTARGYFTYFFGDVAGETRYNDPFPHTLDVDGAENTGNGTEINLPVTYTAEADTGWNIVGNPYTATIDWDDGTWQKTNMSNAIYIWDENTNQYLTWNGISGSLGEGKIAPFQGFWVKANGNGIPELKVRKSSKTTGGTFRKTNPEEDWPSLQIKAEGAGMQHSAFFTFSDDGRNNIDDLDAYRLLPFDTHSYLEIFTLLPDGTELAINSLPRKFGKPVELPVHISGIKNGQFLNEDITLTWPEMKNIPDGWTITLTDTQTGYRVNLKKDQFFDFGLNTRSKTPPVVNTPQTFKLVEKSKAKIQSARFIITIDPGDDAGNLPGATVLNQNFPNPFNPTTIIEFGIPEEGNVRIDVFDMIGRRVQTLTDQRYNAGFHQVQFSGLSLASGIYFYRLITSEKIVDKKMTFIK